MSTMDDQKFEVLVDKLDKITRLLAVSVVKDEQNEQNKVELLDSLGFRPFEIDKFLHKSSGYAAAALSNIRKKKQPKVSETQQVPTVVASREPQLAASEMQIEVEKIPNE